jgi:hypothetical protein
MLKIHGVKCLELMGISELPLTYNQLVCLTLRENLMIKFIHKAVEKEFNLGQEID